MTDKKIETLIAETTRTIQFIEITLETNTTMEEKIFSPEEIAILRASKSIWQRLLDNLICYNETGQTIPASKGRPLLS